MSTFTRPHLLAPTMLAAGTILPPELIPHAVLPGFVIPTLTDINQEPIDARWLDTASGGRRNWMLLTEFDFASEVLERIIKVPVGFVTDFASTPRFMWWILEPQGPWGKGALGHDYLYRTAAINCTRLMADDTFQEMMQVLKVLKWKEKALYAGVRVFGEPSFVPRAA